MPQPGTVPVSAPIDTYAAANTYPTHKANRGLGGYMTTANLTTLAAISADRREQGMCVFVISEGKEYRDWETDRKSTRLNSSHSGESRMPSSA